jgi:hypothetical protein
VTATRGTSGLRDWRPYRRRSAAEERRETVRRHDQERLHDVRRNHRVQDESDEGADDLFHQSIRGVPLAAAATR